MVKLFNIMWDAVVREWHRILWERSGLKGEELEEMTETLFAIFYMGDTYLAARDPVLLQHAINMIVKVFKRVGLETNAKKMQAVTCTPEKIWLRLPAESYRRMRGG